MKIPKTHRLTPLETKLLYALQYLLYTTAVPIHVRKFKKRKE